MTARVYFDWNATAPLRPEARAAMLEAMDSVGNPSSVHAEGRAARAILAKARSQVAAAIGASNADVIFTSGATEAAGLALHTGDYFAAPVEHDCVLAWTNATLKTDASGGVTVEQPSQTALQLANSETGVIQTLSAGLAFTDAVQAFGKIPFAFAWSGASMAALSAHKIGGPKGVGALVVKAETDIPPLVKGGGQEMGRRSGTENIIGIAGFGAAAQAAQRDLEDGVWDRVQTLRDLLEARLAEAVHETIFFGQDSTRLPNTSCFAIPGWKGETQVMQMDLSGFAVSAGSACSSGKVRASGVLTAMGQDDLTAQSAIRVSLGPDTTQIEVHAFVEAWSAAYTRWRERAA